MLSPIIGNFPFFKRALKYRWLQEKNDAESAGFLIASLHATLWLFLLMPPDRVHELEKMCTYMHN